MSRWRSESLLALLEPGRVLLLRRSPLFAARRMRLESAVDAASGPADWRSACESLARLVETAGRAPLSVVLSDAFVRYLTVRWDAAIRPGEESEAYLSHAFSAVYGARASEWQICADQGADGTDRLCAAVDRGLMEVLRAIAPGGRLASVRPLGIAVVGACSQAFGAGPELCAVSRDGRLSVFLVSEAGVMRASSRAIPTAADSVSEADAEAAAAIGMAALDAGAVPARGWRLHWIGAGRPPALPEEFDIAPRVPLRRDALLEAAFA